MYKALSKSHLLRSITAPSSRLGRAVHSPAQSKITASEEFFISTALPDDFDTAPLESEFFQKKTEAGSFDHLTKEEHYAIIYDSINPQLPKGKGKGKNLKAPPEPIQEPGLDEM